MQCGLFAELQGTEQLSGHGARWERKEEGNLRKRGSGGRTGSGLVFSTGVGRVIGECGSRGPGNHCICKGRVGGVGAEGLAHSVRS